MDVAIASALEKFISDKPRRPQRKLFDGVRHSSSALAAPDLGTVGRNDDERPEPVRPSSSSHTSHVRAASALTTGASPQPQLPPTRHRSASPPKAVERLVPDHLLLAEHVASSGQGCRNVLLAPGHTPVVAGPGGGGRGGKGTPGSSLQWLTPRGQDATGVFRLLQKPTVRSVRQALTIEESYSDLLVTVAVEGGSVSDDGRTVVEDPVGLRWLRLFMSQHPKQGFVRVYKADRPVASEILGHVSYFRVVVPGSLMGEYLKLELTCDDPTRMVRIVLLAFSQAASVTVKHRPAAPSPSRGAPEDEERGADSSESSVSNGDDDDSISAANHVELDTTATPHRPRTGGDAERSVLVDLSPPPPPSPPQLPQQRDRAQERPHRNPTQTNTTIPLTVDPAESQLERRAEEQQQRKHEQQHSISAEIPSTVRERRGAVERNSHGSDDRSRNAPDAYNRTLRDVIVEYTKHRVLESSQGKPQPPPTADGSRGASTQWSGSQRHAFNTKESFHREQEDRCSSVEGDDRVLQQRNLRIVSDDALLRQVFTQGPSTNPTPGQGGAMCIVLTEMADDVLSRVTTSGEEEASLMPPAGCALTLIVCCSPGAAVVRGGGSSVLVAQSESFVVFQVAQRRATDTTTRTPLVMVCRSVADAQRALEGVAHRWSPDDQRIRPMTHASDVWTLRVVADETPGATAFVLLASELGAFSAQGPFLLYRLISGRGSGKGPSASPSHDALSLSRFVSGLELLEMPRLTVHPSGDFRPSHCCRYIVRLGRPRLLWWAHAKPPAPPLSVCVADENPMSFQKEVDGYVGSARLADALGLSSNRAALVDSVRSQRAAAPSFVAVTSWEEAVLSALHHARVKRWTTVCIHVDTRCATEQPAQGTAPRKGAEGGLLRLSQDPEVATVSPELFDAWMDTITLWTAPHPRCIIFTSDTGVDGFPEECVAMFGLQSHVP